MTGRIAAGARSIAAWRGMTSLGPNDWQAEVVAESEGERTVVRYHFRAAGGPLNAVAAHRDFIAKFYRDDSGARSFENMRTLGRELAELEPGASLVVPEALHYDRSLRMLLQTEAGGVPLTRLVGGRQAEVAMTACGRALACLHRLPSAGAPVKSMADHIAELIRPDPRELARQHPAAGNLIENTLHGLRQREADWQGTITTVPLHRDFHLRQLFLDADRVWLIDWDLFAAGDPAFDVAYFVVYLKTHLDTAFADALGERFLSAYLDHGGEPSVCERIDVYAAFNYLRRACRRWRLRDAGWQDQFTAMLERLTNSRV